MFSGLSGFTKLTIPNNIDFITSSSFTYTEIETLLINKSERIEAGVFNKSLIKEVLLSPNIEIIEYAAFSGSSIESINLDNIWLINSSAFAGCSHLKGKLTLNKIQRIGFRAFEGCNYL